MTTTTRNIQTSTLAGFMNDGRTWIGHADEARTYDGEVPRQDAIDLLSIPLAEASVRLVVPTASGVVEFEDKTRKAIVRTDTKETFGIFKQGYKMHPYPEWLVETLDTAGFGGLKIGTVALTKGGARAFVQGQLPEGRIATARGAVPVDHSPHVTAATSVDGSIATTYGVGTRVFICENELGLLSWRRFTSQFFATSKVRHTSQSEGRIHQIRTDLGIVVEQIGDAFDEEFARLASEYVSDSKWNDFLKAYTGVDKAAEGRSKTIAQNKVGALNTLWVGDERVAPWKNSAYGVVAAINTATHHIFGADKSRTDRNQNRTIDNEWAKQQANVLSLLASV